MNRIKKITPVCIPLILILLCASCIQFSRCSSFSHRIIVDDGEAIFVGAWGSSTIVPGYLGDGFRYMWNGSGFNTATWHFFVPQGGLWEVYARWTSYENRATDALYTIKHYGNSTTVAVNQQQNGGRWVSLGTFDYDIGEYSASLSDNADGVVIADAIMLVQREIFIDDGEAVFVGAWGSSTIVPGYLGDGFRYMWSGSGFNTATWFFNIPQEGFWEVYARWTSYENRAENALYTVNHADDSTGIHVNQQNNGGEWVSLGVFPFKVGEASVVLSDDANGVVIADAVKLVQRDIIVDDGEAVFVGAWGSSTIVPGYLGDGFRYMWNGSGFNTATWSFDVSEAGLWEVYARWTSYENRAHDAPYTINHESGSSIVRVNQKQMGGFWNSLGVYSFSEGEASVVLSDDADNVVIADALKLVQQKPGKAPICDSEIFFDFSEKLLANRLQLGVQLDWGDWSKVVYNQTYKDYVTAFNCKIFRIFVFRQDGIGGYDMDNDGPCIYWNSTTHSGTFEWDKMDLLLESIHELGGEPILCLMYPYRETPFPRNPEGMAIDPETGLPYPEDWAEYCRVWVEKYGERVRFWEVMNEPDLFWGLDNEDWGKVENLTILYEEAYYSMKKENPNILISHPEVQDIDIFEHHLNNSIPFDFLDFHYYGVGGDTSYGVYSKDVYTNVDTGYSASNKNGLLSLDYCRSILGDVIQICGETNFNSAWKNGSDIRNQKMDGAVFDALQIIEAVKAGSDYRIHFHLSSSPIYDESNPSSDWNLGFGMIDQQSGLPYYPWYVNKMVGGNLEVGDPIYNVDSNNSFVSGIAWEHNGDLNVLIIHSDTLNRVIDVRGLNGEFNFTKIDGSYEYWSPQEQIGIINLSEEKLVLDGYTVVLLQSTGARAEFVLSNLSITPEEVELLGEVDVWTFKISVEVTNVGEQEDTYTFDLKVDGLVVESGTVMLKGGEKITIIHDVTRGVGSYLVEADGLTGGFTVKAPPKPAEFEFSNLRIFYPGVTPLEVEAGQIVTVTVSIEADNVGELEGGHTVELKVDGEVVDSKGVTLEGGASATVLFELTRGEGTYEVEVEGFTDSFTVNPKPSFWEKIPGFPYESIIVGIVVGVLILLLFNRARSRAISSGVNDPLARACVCDTHVFVAEKKRHV